MPLPSPQKGTLQFYPDFKSSGPSPKRDVYVYLPPGFDPRSDRRYPVIYFQDGQQVWDSRAAANGGWKADTTADRLISQGKMEPVIMVGVENTGKRTEEYVGYGAYYNAPPGVNTASMEEIQGWNLAYRQFLTEELKPFIDKTYPTLPDRTHTALIGSSFGAGFSLQLAFSRPDLFSKVAGLSGGNYDYKDESRMEKNFFQPFPFLIGELVKGKKDLVVYLDCGGKDVDEIFLPRTLDLQKALLSAGWKEGQDLRTVVDPTASHNERAWAQRLPGVLEFLFPPRRDS